MMQNNCSSNTTPSHTVTDQYDRAQHRKLHLLDKVHIHLLPHGVCELRSYPQIAAHPDHHSFPVANV